MGNVRPHALGLANALTFALADASGWFSVFALADASGWGFGSMNSRANRKTLGFLREIEGFCSETLRGASGAQRGSTFRLKISLSGCTFLAAGCAEPEMSCRKPETGSQLLERIKVF